MEEIIQRLFKDNFSELAGLTLDASVPLPEQLINEFVQSTLQGNKNITDCYVAIHSGNNLAINLKTPLWPWPVNLKLRLEPAVDFANGVRVSASLENFALLGKLGAIFKAFPEGITMEDGQIIIDVSSFLKEPGQRKWLSLIKSMNIKTEIAKVILDIRIEVE
jgi:hypothetical protein